MRDLINSMLELSKLEQSELPKQDVNFSEIFEGACLEFEATCFEKDVKLITEIQPDLHVYGEPKSLERLAVILLDNAIKYSGDKGKVGARLFADGKRVHLSVMNTGECISKEDAKHVLTASTALTAQDKTKTARVSDSDCRLRLRRSKRIAVKSTATV